MSERASGARSTSLESLLVSREGASCSAGRVASARRRPRRRPRSPRRSHVGGRVLVLTIDPAKRLADALGSTGSATSSAACPTRCCERRGSRRAASCGRRCSTRRQSWDDLVLRHAPDEETAYRILDNRLYDNLTSRFVQSHDYIAMERLYELHSSGQYDLIVIDTPPTRNAIDFLDAPQRMADFFGGRLLRWLTLPYRLGGKRGARLVNFATKPFYQMADRILGTQFLQDIAEFFLNFQSMYGGLRHPGPGRRAAHARPAHDVRGRHDARGRAAARGGVLLRRARRQRDFHLGALVLNRVLPESFADPGVMAAADRLRRRPGGGRGAARRPRRRRARRPGGRRPGAAHGRRVVPELRRRRDPRSGAARASSAASPTCWRPYPASPTTCTTSPGWPGSGSASLGAQLPSARVRADAGAREAEDRPG